MKQKLKKIIIAAIIVSLNIASEGIYAMVESRPGETPLNNITANEMFIRGRRVEQDGEALGLTAVVDQFGNEPISNNIDVHMMKNTEWGAVAYLAQSIYGKGTDNSIVSTGSYTGGGNTPTAYLSNTNKSTTLNAYGVYGMVSGYETYVAAHNPAYSHANMLTIFNARVRYKDVYTTTDTSDIPGGATLETYNWYGQNRSDYRKFGTSYIMITRGYNSGLFTYQVWSDGSALSSYRMRLAIVNGTGL